MTVKLLKAKSLAIGLFVASGILSFWFLSQGDFVDGFWSSPDNDKAKNLAPFVAIVAPMFTLGAALLTYENLRVTSTQNVSSNFFKLMEMHHKLRDNIAEDIWQISTAMNPSKGKAFFDHLAERISYDFHHLPMKLSLINEPVSRVHVFKTTFRIMRHHNRTPNVYIKIKDEDEVGKLKKIYDYYFHVHQSELGHYFRNLYYLVRYVDEARINKILKTTHLKMLRAQLSNYELVMLAYNCIHDYGEAFYDLVEKYELLKSINDESRVPLDYERRIVDFALLNSCYPHLDKYSKQTIEKRKYKMFGRNLLLSTIESSYQKKKVIRGSIGKFKFSLSKAESVS